MTGSSMIKQAYLDWSFNEDAQRNYKFAVKSTEHSLPPSARVQLTRIGQPISQLGTVLRVEDDGIIIHTDEWLDISEEYSIELFSSIVQPPSG